LIILSILEHRSTPKSSFFLGSWRYHRFAPAGVNSNSCCSAAQRNSFPTVVIASGSLRSFISFTSFPVDCSSPCTLVSSGGSQYVPLGRSVASVQSSVYTIVALPRTTRFANSTAFFLSIRLPLLRLQLIPDRQLVDHPLALLFTLFRTPTVDRGAPVCC
jgi:hypothetical protein